MKVALRPLEPTDAETAVHWRNDPAVWTYTTAKSRERVDVATERAWIERVATDSTNHRCAILADGIYVGNVYLTDIRDGSAQFHIFIGDRGIWGRGVGRRATAAILAIGWRKLDLDSIYLLVHCENVAALALYRSLGFTAAGDEGAFVRMAIANPYKPGDGDT